MEVKVTVDLINKVLNYLATRPYAEVTGLINDIHQMVVPQIPPQESVPKENE